MNLMTGEEVLLESPGKNLVLTSHRVRYQVESVAYTQIQSIMLEELCSCAMARITNPVFLVLAALCAIGGIIGSAVSGEAAPAAVGIVLAGILVFLFFVARQEVLALASAGTTIRVSTKGMKVENVKQFIEATEAAKNTRYLLAKGI